jgi:hypothetical protein
MTKRKKPIEKYPHKPPNTRKPIKYSGKFYPLYNADPNCKHVVFDAFWSGGVSSVGNVEDGIVHNIFLRSISKKSYGLYGEDIAIAGWEGDHFHLS